MGKGGGKKKGTTSSGGGGGGGGGGFSTLDVDPRHVRYAHSKIKPLFSGCGRTIEQTLGEIRDSKTRASDLPMITVLLGPTDPACDGEQCFFSLNNRRLFVFKACREEGLLGPSGLVRVRARAMKPHERERYTVDRCSLQAKFLFATPKPPPTTTSLQPLLSSPKGAGTPVPTSVVAVGVEAEAHASSTAAATTTTGAAVERARERSQGEGVDDQSTQRRGEKDDGVERAVRTEREAGGGGGSRSGGVDALTLREEEREQKDQALAGITPDGERRFRAPRTGNQSTNVARDTSPAAAMGDNDGKVAGGTTQETTIATATHTNAQLRGKKGARRRKSGGQRGGGGGEWGNSEGVSGGVGSVFRNEAADGEEKEEEEELGGKEVPVVELSRKQEQARSGRRHRNTVL